MTLPSEIRFDGWLLRTDSGELTRGAKVVRLQEQPLQVLLALLDRPGAMVAREQLIARLWPKGVVDYETGLNTVVRKLRAALEDDAGEPRYIETIPRRGYRFIGTVEAPPVPDDGARGDPPIERTVAPAPEPVPTVTPAPLREERRWRPWVASLALLLLVALALGTRSLWQPQARVADSVAVLPFKPLVPEAASPALELGMADTLIMQLSRIPGLRVSPLYRRAVLRCAGSRSARGRPCPRRRCGPRRVAAGGPAAPAGERAAVAGRGRPHAVVRQFRRAGWPACSTCRTRSRARSRPPWPCACRPSSRGSSLARPPAAWRPTSIT
ncbi:MAG: winged helix-turn-helix domain-containing protein [Desulfobacterales bacterium]|nr:winged helix-turn-helix domain-containing protein [Desulfobacterales bacterium]